MAKKVQPGDKLKIPAAAYNSFVDAAEAHKANMFKQSPGKDQPGDNLVLVKNNNFTVNILYFFPNKFIFVL